MLLGVSAQAPPGFRAAPHAVFAVTAIRLQSLTPSRLWRCALRLPPGESPAGHPRRAMLGAPRCCRTGWAGSARPAPRWTGCWGVLADTPGLAAAGCANACRPQRWRFVPITSRTTVHGQPTRHRYGDCTPRLKTSTARCGGGVFAWRWGIDLVRVNGQAGAAFMRGCRVGPISLRCGSAQGVLVSL